MVPVPMLLWEGSSHCSDVSILIVCVSVHSVPPCGRVIHHEALAQEKEEYLRTETPTTVSCLMPVAASSPVLLSAL